MPTYITLIRYTQKGIENIKGAPNRVEEAKQVHRSMGAELKEFYLVMGNYDAVSIAEAPDDVTMTKVLLSLGSKGNVHTETLKAFTEEEVKKIVTSLP